MTSYREMKATLEGDTVQSLINTHNEYVEGTGHELKPSAKVRKADLIQEILELMVQAGDVESDESTFKLTDLAREIGMNPKVARDKMRRAIRSLKPVPTTVKPKSWVFKESDRPTVRWLLGVDAEEDK